MNCGDCKYSHDTGTALLCWGQRFAPPVDADHWCEGWKPKSVTQQTNADRIRGMTDEELAKWLCVMNIDDCPDKAHERHCTDKCYECWLDWLKSPMEVDE